MMDELLKMDRRLRIGLLLSGFFISFFFFFKFANGWFIIVAFIFLGVLIASNIKYDQQYHAKVEKSIEVSLLQHNFTADDSYLSDDFLSGIAINEAEQKLALLNRINKNSDFTFKTIDFKDILECSIIEDGETITRTSKSSAVGGAVVGGMLAGGVGAVIGSLSGKKSSSEQILKTTLEIVVDDLMNPIHEIHFLNSNMLFDKNSALYQQLYAEMNKWNRRLSIIIKRNESNNRSIME